MPYERGPPSIIVQALYKLRGSQVKGDQEWLTREVPPVSKHMSRDEIYKDALGLRPHPQITGIRFS